MAAKKHLNVALIGQAFMGRTHSTAWTQVRRFFDLPIEPVQHTVCARDAESLAEFAPTFGWAHTSTNWRKVVNDPEIDLVDIGVPNHMHKAIALEAIRAGKIVACEKPLAGTLDDAREMAATARKAKAQTFVWYNYRRCPAVAYAQQLVKAGKIGQVRHVRGFYLQDWADESVPLIWRFQKKVAGSGSNGDLCAHAIDMTRFVLGEEITEITGAMLETFIKERTIPTAGSAGGIAAGAKGGGKKGKVTVDDAVLFLARFSGGAVAQFEATRMATGRQNDLGFEINGTKGALRFEFERMNELQYYDATGDRGTQGWRTIMCTHGGEHPYTDAWWPDAHVLGYEHGFTNMAYDICRVVAGQKPLVPLPDFADAFVTNRILEAVVQSAKDKAPVKLARVK